MKKTGKCLCGKVTITVDDFQPEVSACHCSMCRRWTAGPFLSVDAGKSDNITITPESAVTRYQSSEWAERGFCTTCGSSLFYHGLADDDYYVAADLFDDLGDALLMEEIFYDNKPDYYEFANDTEKSTEADIMAMIQASFEETEEKEK